MAYKGIRKVLDTTSTVNVPASGTAQYTLNVPTGSAYLLAVLDVTLAASCSISSIQVDGVTVPTANPLDFTSTYGGHVWCEDSVVITLTNSDVAAADCTVRVRGLQVR